MSMEERLSCWTTKNLQISFLQFVRSYDWARLLRSWSYVLLAREIQVLDLSNRFSSKDSSIWTYIPKPNTTRSKLGPPTLNDGAMWLDNSDNLYLFGGVLRNAPSAAKEVPPQGTWKHRLGTKEWSDSGYTGEVVQRIHYGSAAQASDGTAYYLGGAITPRSDPTFNALPNARPYMVSGLVTFDLKTSRFGNESTLGMNPNGTMTGGYMALVESLGQKGALVGLVG